MSGQYEEIPGSSSKDSSVLVKVAGVIVGALAFTKFFSQFQVPVDPVVDPAPAPQQDPWPSALVTGPNLFLQPHTTAAIEGSEWTKVDEPCNPKLGEAYRKNGGVKSKIHPQTLYFTPAVGDTPGLLSGISVDYYQWIGEPLIGTYFGDVQTGPDGTYRTLELALRDYDEHDLCDTTAPISHVGLEKVTIAPELIATNIPLNESDEELQNGWEEGSCMYGMGTHWGMDVVGGNVLTYEAANMVPIIPMYGKADGKGDLQAVFFYSGDTEQTFPADCQFDFTPGSTQPCAEGRLTDWDINPGLLEADQPPFFACSNWCRADCAWTGSQHGVYSTMHFSFKDLSTENCNSPEFVSCRA